jgi:Cu/Ag efflux pump CusA
MTALAMIIGMIPMAMSLGEGGEQNAPLGRAVIGGLICATVATLFLSRRYSVSFTISCTRGERVRRFTGGWNRLAIDS